MRRLILLSNIIILCLLVFGSEDEKEAVVLRAVRGREANIPCRTEKIFLDGPNAYIVWMKNDKILYRYPNPKPEIRRGTRDHVLKASCDSDICPDETWLIIKKVTDRDEGLYRCRIHYQGSPTEDYMINLKLVESTGMPMIYTADGELLKRGFVGPFSLDSDVTLVCQVDTKNLKTEVYWLRNGAVVGQASSSGRILHIDVHLHKLSRGDFNAQYDCLVQNADVTEPMVASVVIKMNLAPMSVQIRMNDNYHFEVGQPRVIDCVVVGSMPPPAITWHLGKKMVRPSVHKELRDGNYTVSSLTLVPSINDDLNELVCTAYNPYASANVYQDKVTINVGFRPICKVGYAQRVGAVTNERETVKCVVDSSPEPIKFRWTFEDSKNVYTTSFTRVKGYPNRYTSTLTWLSRDADIGKLLCRATNLFGEQKEACTYKISAGGPPELPKCSVRKINPNSLSVQCLKGWDGGRPQMIHLDIVDGDGKPIRKVADKTGKFYVPNILDQVNLSAVLYAASDRGNSKKKIIYLHNLPTISEADNQNNWLLYIQASSVALVMAIFLTILIIGAKILLARGDIDSDDDGEEINLDIVPLPNDTPDDVIINIQLNVPSTTFPLPPGTMLEAQGTLQTEPLEPETLELEPPQPEPYLPNRQRIYYV